MVIPPPQTWIIEVTTGGCGGRPVTNESDLWLSLASFEFNCPRTIAARGPAG